MRLGEAHHIILIKNNDELIKLNADSEERLNEWHRAIKQALGVEQFVIQNVLDRDLRFYGLREEPNEPGWIQRNGYWVPSRKTKAGKAINAKIDDVGRTFPLAISQWMRDNNLMLTACITRDTSIPSLTHTVITTNKEGTEFLLFYPQPDISAPIPEAIAALGEEISYGNYYDNYSKTHMYQTR